MERKEKYNVAIAGATGAVGQEMMQILEERKFPVGKLILLASERSQGKKYSFCGRELSVSVLGENSFRGIDIALFSAGSERSRKYAVCAVASGAVVVDNSSAFRMDPEIPLVVPEINPSAATLHTKKGIVANPNCTTAVALMALKPIYDISRIKRVVATSFQAVSGAGAGGIAELERQVRSWSESRELPRETNTFPHQIAFNVIPHIDSFTQNGYTKEEMKLHNETRKILGDDSILLTATTVRVPVFRSHCISLNLETERKVTVEEARDAIRDFPGVSLVDDPENSDYPMPVESSGKNNCFVGRIREDYTVKKGLSLWVSGDQLKKGAALNTVQIAELLVRKNV
ncbi:MAG: aspartate-semialdehyde dehydrogenase [Candidatus Dadabacteria bacterium]|nr:aspartate-semialdehyde dehydrogenase [Candidatus Dadabacteria bacterium]